MTRNTNLNEAAAKAIADEVRVFQGIEVDHLADKMNWRGTRAGFRRLVDLAASHGWLRVDGGWAWASFSGRM